VIGGDVMLRSLTWIVQIVFAVGAGLSAQAATVADFYELAKPAGPRAGRMPI
jgi:hypothetical protein